MDFVSLLRSTERDIAEAINTQNTTVSRLGSAFRASVTCHAVREELNELMDRLAKTKE